MTELTDEQLAAAAQSGDAGAEAELLSRYKPLVKAIARKYFLTGGDGEDLVQEGMIGLYYAIRTFQPDKKAAFRTYGVMCVKNRIADVIRGDQRNKNRPLNESVPIVKYNPESDEEFVMELFDPTGDPADEIIRREHGQELQNKIKEAVTAREYAVLALYFRGLSYAEIAERLGLSSKTVDNSLQSVKRKIRKLLG